MKNANVVIRDAGAEDIQTVIRLDEIHTGLAKPEYWRDMVQSRSGHNFLVAEIAGAVVGFIVGDVRTWEFGSPPCGWVFAVNVSPDCREGGIGSGLLAAMCQRFESAGVATVRTMISRDDALNLAFFRSQGMTAGPYIELEKTLNLT